MLRSLATLVAASAIYGFCVGSAYSWLYASRNVVKFPLMILATAAICALSYFVLARFLGTSLPFAAVQRVVLEIFRDIAVLLASLSPAVFYFGATLRPVDGRDLGEFPLFLGLNVAVIAICGCLAVAVRAAKLEQEHDLRGRRRALLVGGWMLVSLLVGGQVCWYMRPYFGIAGPSDEIPPFFAGPEPNFWGARSFYEAVFFVVLPPEGWR